MENKRLVISGNKMIRHVCLWAYKTHVVDIGDKTTTDHVRLCVRFSLSVCAWLRCDGHQLLATETVCQPTTYALIHAHRQKEEARGENSDEEEGEDTGQKMCLAALYNEIGLLPLFAVEIRLDRLHVTRLGHQAVVVSTLVIYFCGEGERKGYRVQTVVSQHRSVTAAVGADCICYS